MTGPGASAEYEVTAVRYGTRMARRSEVFLHFELYREPDRELAMDYFVWVARNADRTVLIDCGFNEGSGARRDRTMLCPPVEALRQVGVGAAEVSQLVVTHAHYDHIGNLLSFPAARVVVADREFAFWTSPLSRKPLFMTSAEEADIDALRQLSEAGRVAFVSGRASVAPGIEVVEIGGHTPGQLAVIVGTARGATVLPRTRCTITRRWRKIGRSRTSQTCRLCMRASPGCGSRRRPDARSSPGMTRR